MKQFLSFHVFRRPIPICVPLFHRSLVGVVVLNIIVTTLGCVIPSVIFRSQIISMKTDADAKVCKNEIDK